MSNSVKLLLIHALSPVHCGTGQAVGGIDLPFVRERPTGIPLIPGSSLKGVLRAGPVTDADLHRAVFGPDTDRAGDHAGNVQISDANLLFLPVRSACGTFAWVSSPYMLRRFARDAREVGLPALAPPTLRPAESAAVVSTASALRVPRLDNKVVFEDYDLLSEPSAEIQKFAEDVASRLWPGEDCEPDRRHFAERVCVVHDDVMALFLTTCMEISTRIKLNPETKTVDKKVGALWTEEALPVESILSGLVVATPVKLPRTSRDGGPDRYKEDTLLGYLQGLVGPGVVQLGGKATVGRGLCRVRMVG